MKILIIGGGGREHALLWKLSQSPRISKLYVAPGNAGTAKLAENVDVAATDIESLVKFALDAKIDLTVVGQDDPLALGVVDAFQAAGLKIWGPTKAAAQIEASKAFAKKMMLENGIPTAKFETFGDYKKALECARAHLSPSHREGGEATPIVVKASGLALGKGVTICQTLEEAKDTLKKVMIEKIFGQAGAEVVIEEFLQGQEFSIHAFTDGKTFKLLPPSQDHKPIFDGDQGPNTGGMGTIAPLPWVTQDQMNEIAERIVRPALDGLKKLGIPFVGLLYPGLIFASPLPNPPPRGEGNGNGNSSVLSSPFPPAGRAGRGEDKGGGEIKVLEFNARFGDPECQSYMRLLKTDLFEIIESCVEGRLSEINIEWEQKFACCIALASGGYPGKYQKGFEISGIAEAEKIPGVKVFHAGTEIRSGKLVTSGGRVLGVTATGETLPTALNLAYQAIEKIHFEGMQYRKDIGAKTLNLSR